MKEEEPLTGDAPDPRNNVLPKGQVYAQIAGVDELYQLYHDGANSCTDPSNARIPEEECERWTRSASLNGDQEWSRIVKRHITAEPDVSYKL